jgi:hypothetical protein
VPVSPEDDWTYWDSRATSLTRTQLAGVNASAAKWQALATSLLAVFGTVAFAGGLTTLDELSEPWGVIAQVLTTLAVASGVVGVVLLALAAGGLRVDTVTGPLDGMALRDLHERETERQASRLRAGRLAAVTTAGLVLAGSLLILWFGQPGPSDPPAFVAVFEDGAACGSLSLGGGGELLLAGRPLSDGLVSISSVDACPGS